MTTNDTRNVELHIKMKNDWVVVPSTLRQYDREGFYIGEDLYLQEEFTYDEEAERLIAKDGKLKIQL